MTKDNDILEKLHKVFKQYCAMSDGGNCCDPDKSLDFELCIPENCLVLKEMNKSKLPGEKPL